MKNLLGNGVLIVITIGILYIIYLREWKQDRCPPKGYTVVSNTFIDSLKKVANMKPLVIVKDSIVYRDTIIYVNHPVPYPLPIDSTTNLYRDSLYNDSIRVWTDITVNGRINRIVWKYQPVIFQRDSITTIFKPYPVPYEVPIKKTGLYISGKIGGNENMFIYGVDLDMINKKDNLYGIQYQRLGPNNLYLFKVGIKLRFK